MTILLVILDPDTTLLHYSGLPPSELARHIEAGDWGFAAWIHSWMPAKPGRVTVLDGLVVAGGVDMPEQVLPAEPSQAPAVSLSPQQVRVLEGLMEGLTARQIAASLYLSERAVDEYTQEIKRKLQARTMAQSVGRAVALGYWKPPRKKR